jgi:hypothetical protein
MIDERDVRPEGQAAAGWEGSSGLDQPAIRLVECRGMVERILLAREQFGWPLEARQS